METLPQKPRLHLLICTNDRRNKPEDTRPSCCPRVTDEDVKQLKKWVVGQGLSNEIYVTRTGCLGFCHAEGSNAAIYPRKRFVLYQTVDDIKQLILDELKKV